VAFFLCVGAQETPMKAAGVARKQNRERLALTARLDKKLSDAATECMKKMVTSDIVRVRSLWKDWSWIKGTQGHVGKETPFLRHLY
jgi:hypothetical protein